MLPQSRGVRANLCFTCQLLCGWLLRWPLNIGSCLAALTTDMSVLGRVVKNENQVSEWMASGRWHHSLRYKVHEEELFERMEGAGA